MTFENYSNWDTFECVNWVLNSEPIKDTVLNGNSIEARKAILSHMTMVKYCYSPDIELNNINIQEVIDTVRDI